MLGGGKLRSFLRLPIGQEPLTVGFIMACGQKIETVEKTVSCPFRA
jgi:hypothetical protein